MVAACPYFRHEIHPRVALPQHNVIPVIVLQCFNQSPRVFMIRRFELVTVRDYQRPVAHANKFDNK
jgi:hypothetical protein